MSEYSLPNANIEVTGRMSDGRAYRLNTTGSVVVRMKRKKDIYYYDSTMSIPEPEEYELIAALEYDFMKDSVFTIKVEPVTVMKSITTAAPRGVDVDLLAKRLGVPVNHKMTRAEATEDVTFSWEERV